MAKLIKKIVGGLRDDSLLFCVYSRENTLKKQAHSEHKKAIKQCTNLLQQIDKWSDNDLPNRLDIQANVYCLAGNSYLEMGNYNMALEFHEKDNIIGKKHKLEEATSRSIDNIGRVYAKKGQFKNAIKIWNEKVAISKSALESTWLHHEMGRCYLELGDYDLAMEYGEKSIDYAREAADDTWQMNASILVAQAALKSNRFSLAIENFDRALEYSKIVKNCDAEEAIKIAIEETNAKMIEDSKESGNRKNDNEDYGCSMGDDTVRKTKGVEENKQRLTVDSDKTDNNVSTSDTLEIVTREEHVVTCEDKNVESDEVVNADCFIKQNESAIETNTIPGKRYSPTVSDIEEISIGGDG